MAEVRTLKQQGATAALGGAEEELHRRGAAQRRSCTEDELALAFGRRAPFAVDTCNHGLLPSLLSKTSCQLEGRRHGCPHLNNPLPYTRRRCARSPPRGRHEGLATSSTYSYTYTEQNHRFPVFSLFHQKLIFRKSQSLKP